MININKYCNFVSFSLRIILESVNETITVPAPKITAAMPFPSERANMYVA